MKFFRWEDEFIKHTGLMTFGVGLFNFFNFLYHLYMVRALTPIEYGHLNTIMAVFMVISVPASTLQTTVTKFVSSFNAQKRYDLIRNLLKHLIFITSIIALVIFIIIFLISGQLTNFLKISPRSLIVLLGALLSFAMVIPIPWGGLQGLQKFGSLTFNLIMNGVLKFLLGILFILLGLGIFGALSAIVLSYVATTFLSLMMLKIENPQKNLNNTINENSQEFNPHYFQEVYHYFLPAGLTLLSFMILTNIDLILVKHFFKPVEAGYYSIAQMVGKIILFLPIPVVMAMFPKLNALEGHKEKMLSILSKSLLIVLILCIIVIFFVYSFPNFILKVLSGKVYPECIPLVKFFSINMTIFSFLLIILYYHLSTHKRYFLFPLIFFTLVQTICIIFFHNSLIQVLLIVGSLNLFLLMINLYLVYHKTGIKDNEHQY